jgi:hypothetical protein
MHDIFDFRGYCENIVDKVPYQSLKVRIAAEAGIINPDFRAASRVARYFDFFADHFKEGVAQFLYSAAYNN